MKHENVISSAGFSPDGTRIVTASWDHTARLWDGKTGAALEILRGHANSVWSAVFSFDGRRIVTASQDKTSRIWDVATGSVIAVLNGHEDTVRSATFSPDGTRIATASVDATARLWKMPPLCQALIDTARKELPRELSPIERSRYFLQEPQSDAISRVYDALGPLLALLPAHGRQSCQ